MLASPLSLATAQLSRSTAREIGESPAPWREASLEALRRRNAVLDTLFYDVANVTPAEAASISPWLAREGALLLVPPTGRGELTLCQDIDHFAAAGGREVKALTIAGVGSSALGSAAFARNVADALEQAVAAVVSGYGLADLVTEAAGGWFWFGALNGLRHAFEQLDKAAQPTGTDSRPALVSGTDRAPFLATSSDTKVVYALLSDARFSFRLLTGHSKGNLVLSEALYALERAARKPPDDTRIVTVSATIAMPPRYTRIVDVMGQLDWFGALNSRPTLSVERRPYLAWHHTNTELWFHLPVTQVFRDLLTTGDL